MTMISKALPFLLVIGTAGCVETGVGGRTGGDDPGGGGPGGINPDGSANPWPDSDDCIDDPDCEEGDCDLNVPRAGSITISDTCSALVSPHDYDPWDVVIKWRWEGITVSEDRTGNGVPENVTYKNVMMAPIVGNLTDDNGDGRIDSEDMPDIAFVAFVDTNDRSGYLLVLDGSTGDQILAQPGWLPFGGIVMADVTGDGVTEIVGFNSAGRPQAVRADGSLVWTASNAITSTYPQATVADLDGDGRVEVLADNLVLDGATGDQLFRADIHPSIIGRMPAIGDLDLDGLQEFMLGQDVYNLDRRSGEVVVTKKWSTPVRGSYGHWAAILDVNGDPFGEVAVIGDGRLVIHRHDGPILVDVAAGTDQPGPPCVADFDGDGISEIAWGSSETFNVYALDGTSKWSFPMRDLSGLAGCSAYDINADGSYEILFGDEEAFYIFDGKTGQIRHGNLGHASGTIFEYPVIADVDRDGSADVVLASANYRIAGWAGVTVFSHATGGWARSGPTWHVHDFSVTNITEDGRVPARPEPSWHVHNVYRARPTTNETFVDLQVAVADVCFTGCDRSSDIARISVQVYNTGSSTSRAEVPVALYTVDGDQRELLQVRRLRQRVPAGGVSAGIVFEVPALRVARDGFYVVVNDDGSGFLDYQEECDYDNNDMLWNDIPCF
ncbi:MAG: hypothetical protein EA397_02950 [Deltaproteobacteria bacterium]|nr:MAG: hypothetical protein EA397_02950 [Deltaproteobacteria bacterium]